MDLLKHWKGRKGKNRVMTKQQQDERRELKAERRELDRAVTARSTGGLGFADLPKSWSHARRGRQSARSRECAYRETVARIGQIASTLNAPLPPDPPRPATPRYFRLQEAA